MSVKSFYCTAFVSLFIISQTVRLVKGTIVTRPRQPYSSNVFATYENADFGEDDSSVDDDDVIADIVRKADRQNQPDLSQNPDAHLNTLELLRKYGYPAESHEVITQDGYILTLHRIPFGRKNVSSTSNTTSPRPVVLLHHGLLCSSSDWLMNTVDKALGYQLADAGWDVWMANARGNMYSRRHMSISPKESEFWKFSFHEVAIYDVPAAIDYILATTGQQRLHWIGHSMGTVVFWIAMSEYPHYNAKIKSPMIALGPVAFLNGTLSPIRYFKGISTELEVAESLLGEKEFLPHHGILSFLEPYICEEKWLERTICENIAFMLCGYDRAQLNETMVPVIVGHNPAGTSSHTIIHFLQLMKSGKFRQFDFGRRNNMINYGVPDPPEYDLSKVTAKVALFYGQNDWLAVPGDVLELAGKLPNVILTHKVKLESFNHLDFLYAIDSNKLLYTYVFKLLRK